MGRPGKWFLALTAAAAAVAATIGLGRLATAPEDPVALLAQAQSDFKAGRFDEAQASLDRLAGRRPPGPMEHMARAQVAQARNRPEDALAEARAIFDDPELGPLARLLAGRIEVSRNRLRAAEAHFSKAAQGLPREPQPREELAYIYNLQHRWDDFDRVMLELSRLDALSFKRLVHWGKARQATWAPLEDCRILARSVEADPDDRASRLVLAEGLRRMNRLDEAEEALRHLPESDAEGAAVRASIAMDRGEAEVVESILRAAPLDHPATAQGWGRLALNRSDAEGAVQAFRRAVSASPYDRGSLQGLGAALRLAGKADEAAKSFEAADRHDAITPLIMRAATAEGAADPTLPAKLGAACAAAGRHAEAVAWYRLALANNPLDREMQQTVFRLEREIAPR